MAFPIEAFIEESKKKNRSDEFIKATTDFVKSIEIKGFPALFSRIHFAMEVGLPSDDIAFLLKNRAPNYTYFLINKKLSQSKREIMAPKEKIKFVQRWINYNILQKADYNEHIMGFVPGRSTLKNALAHKDAKFLLKIDLLKFFDCITQKRVYGIFRSFGYPKNLCMDFSMLCTERHRKEYWTKLSDKDRKLMSAIIDNNVRVLPQGAPTSPLLANLSAARLDKRISKIAKESSFVYTRYADDLCFSCNQKSSLPNVLFLKKIIEEEGFFINEQKVHLSKAGTKQYVTGLSITGDVSVSKNKRREIFKHLYFLRKVGLQSHLNHLLERGEYRTNFRDWLFGHISYQYSIDKKIGQKMFEMFNLVNWEIGIDISRLEDKSRIKRNIGKDSLHRP
jgi:RNA-directed DNA polymerase